MTWMNISPVRGLLYILLCRLRFFLAWAWKKVTSESWSSSKRRVEFDWAPVKLFFFKEQCKWSGGRVAYPYGSSPDIVWARVPCHYKEKGIAGVRWWWVFVRSFVFLRGGSEALLCHHWIGAASQHCRSAHLDPGICRRQDFHSHSQM